jgi:hypothetical protein
VEEVFDAALVADEAESLVDQQTSNRAVGHDRILFRQLRLQVRHSFVIRKSV